MGLVSGFQNVALGGHLRYGLMSREDKIDDLLSVDPMLKGLSIEKTLNKMANLAIATPSRECIFPTEGLARYVIRNVSSSIEEEQPLKEREVLYDKAFNFARWVTDDTVEQDKFYASMLKFSQAAPIMTQEDFEFIQVTIKEDSPNAWDGFKAEQQRVEKAYGR
ncbi:MAG: hypothetical protein COB36_06605 [Alphaproteobacteria bacterium]|nr:MAG: hypothetical protein COB36_06605 [Alphaproteobacteria bacterium]